MPSQLTCLTRKSRDEFWELHVRITYGRGMEGEEDADGEREEEWNRNKLKWRWGWPGKAWNNKITNILKKIELNCIQTTKEAGDRIRYDRTSPNVSGKEAMGQ